MFTFTLSRTNDSSKAIAIVHLGNKWQQQTSLGSGEMKKNICKVVIWKHDSGEG